MTKAWPGTRHLSSALLLVGIGIGACGGAFGLSDEARLLLERMRGRVTPTATDSVVPAPGLNLDTDPELRGETTPGPAMTLSDPSPIDALPASMACQYGAGEIEPAPVASDQTPARRAKGKTVARPPRAKGKVARHRNRLPRAKSVTRRSTIRR